MAHFVRKEWVVDDLSFSRQEKTVGCEYHAYVPDPLCGRSFTFRDATAALVAKAESAIRQMNINAVHLAQAEGLARLLLRAEAAASSMIEGMELPADRLLRAEAAREFKSESRHDFLAREVLGNVDAMVAALDAANAEPAITLETLTGIHTHLMTGTESEAIAGKLRPGAGWIGGNSYDPCEAFFVPPPAEEIPRLLGDVAEFCNDTALPAVAQAALAHAQFETIHPFPDGNGRVGRALIQLILRRRGVSPCWCTPVSLVLATFHQDYIAGLRRYSYDADPESPEALADIDAWVSFFARACIRGVHDASIFEQRVWELQTQWRERLGPDRAMSVEQLIDVLPGTAIVTIGSASRLLDRSFVEARGAINRLVSAKILREVRVDKVHRAFEATEIIDAFTQLERRLASPKGDTRVSPPVRAVPKRLPEAADDKPRH